MTPTQFIEQSSKRFEERFKPMVYSSDEKLLAYSVNGSTAKAFLSTELHGLLQVVAGEVEKMDTQVITTDMIPRDHILTLLQPKEEGK